MKKLLIGTSALVALGALPAVAMAEAPSLTISGAVDVAFSVGDNDRQGSNDGVDGAGMGFGNSSTQIVFDWVGSSDNGLTYGARLDYRFQNTNVDEQYVFLSGGWGRLVVGGDDGVIDNNVPGGESVLVGDFGYDGNNQFSNQIGDASVVPTLAIGTDDAMKFSYYSPNFHGFSAGFSYVPNVNNGAATTGSGIANNGSNNRGTAPQFEGTLAYSGSFEAVGFSAGIGYGYQDGADGWEDNSGLMVGATLSYAGFSAGVGYGDNFDTGCRDNADCDGGHWINIGLAYSFGPGAVSVGYASAEADLDGADDDDSDALTFDAEYTVAEGLKAYSSLNFYDSDDGNLESDSTQGLVGLTVSF